MRRSSALLAATLAGSCSDAGSSRPLSGCSTAAAVLVGSPAAAATFSAWRLPQKVQKGCLYARTHSQGLISTAPLRYFLIHIFMQMRVYVLVPYHNPRRMHYQAVHYLPPNANKDLETIRSSMAEWCMPGLLLFTLHSVRQIARINI